MTDKVQLRWLREPRGRTGWTYKPDGYAWYLEHRPNDHTLIRIEGYAPTEEQAKQEYAHWSRRLGEFAEPREGYGR